GLVDELGGLDVAIDLCRQRAGETTDVDCAVVKAPRTTPKPPELPAPFVQVLEPFAGTALFDLLALALGTTTTERVLAYGGGVEIV
ncbi:MAG TPA: hypothetical protein VGL13_05410, partial [Polyangiaceae bacterium]